MGRESNVERDRLCKECQREWFFTAKELLEHSEVCRRLKAINLELPARPQLAPGNLIIQP